MGVYVQCPLVLQGFLLSFWFHWVYPEVKDAKVDNVNGWPLATTYSG